ncbi:AAA family ATPase [Streptomyces sp. NBC_00390]|uniref:bifunctional aminoglycoside phosphotransferase/ATP-binding protein n=1 Tax=Streptomyces sp. NBC_00390 TaxID=2975736 RepID=UPI002E1B4780
MSTIGSPHGDPSASRAEVHETHAATVVLIGDRAYKVKKCVDLGFLDFSTPGARRTACEQEVALNRRFAPDVYEGVAELHAPWSGPPEPVVVMRRMPSDRRLAHLVSVGVPVDDALRQVARLLATAHAKSPRGAEISAQGTRDALLGRWQTNLQSAERTADQQGLRGIADIDREVRRYLEGRQALFDLRIREERVVDGHGDLLAQDIFCLDDGPRVLDCLEFDDKLRYVDGLDDAAFLAMDLEQLGAPGAGKFFLARYSEYSGDPAPPSLRHHFVAYRAFVRAKVSLFQAQQGARARQAADRLADMTLRHLRNSAVRLILVGGLPLSGKSTLAAALADRLGLTLLSSDRTRKELAGIQPERSAAAPFETGIYTSEWTTRTYGELINRARRLLSVGESVVIDATWSSQEWRDAGSEAARLCSADLVSLKCQIPRGVADDRLRHRAPGPSDADSDVLAAMAARTEPWPEAVIIDTSGALGAATERAMAVLHPDDIERTGVFRRPYMEPD